MKIRMICALAGWLIAGVFAAFAQTTSPGPSTSTEQTSPSARPTPAQMRARQHAHRVKFLTDALHALQRNNDQDSAVLISEILESMNGPEGDKHASIIFDRDRIQNRLHELVLNGSLGSAGILNEALGRAFMRPIPSQPPEPNERIAGSPGPAGLVLYLPFDQPDLGGVIHDESGAGNDGRVYGAQWVPDGKFGGAYRFYLTNFDDRIVIPNSDSLDPPTITLAAWVKLAGTNDFWSRIFDKDYAYGYDLTMTGDYAGAHPILHDCLGFETGRGGIYSSQNVPNDNQWHHVAAVYDGRHVECYIDGVKTSRVVGQGGSLRKAGWDLCIGNSVVDYGTKEILAFDGWIDEVRIYNHALSDHDIYTLATATNTSVGIISGSSTNADWADPTEQMQKLKDLYSKGAITKDQYDQQAKQIMDSY